jgi:integrase
MPSKTHGLIRRGATYYARMGIPADVRQTLGRREFVETLKTSDLREAQFLRMPILAKWVNEIAQARGIKNAPPFDIEAAKRAINHWRESGGKNPLLWRDAPETTLHRLTRTEHAVQEDFDNLMLAALRERRVYVTPGHPQLAELRPHFKEAWQHVENILQKAFAEIESIKVAFTPPPAMILSELGRRWLEKFPPPGEKELGKIQAHQRRLIEFLGDVSVADVTAMQLDDYLTTLRKFPRNRSTALNKLPIRELVTASNDESPRLSDKTRREWFSTVNRMFAYAVQLDQARKNPAAGLDKAKKTSLKRRAYNEAELKLIFGSVLYEPGSRHNAKYWLPILCYFHGARLNEIGAARLADFKQTDGVWHFDLTDRKLKTEASERLIPLHPAMLDLGWLAYVEAMRERGETYLFPELPHSSRYGATHEFSKWWGRWARDLGVTDPHATFHSFRHGWKRAARASPVKEELHDILSGHKSIAVSRTYGDGATLAILADNMKLITLPTLPLAG